MNVVIGAYRLDIATCLVVVVLFNFNGINFISTGNAWFLSPPSWSRFFLAFDICGLEVKIILVKQIFWQTLPHAQAIARDSDHMFKYKPYV